MEIDHDARRLVSAAGLVGEAVDLMSEDAYGDIDFADLVMLKKLLKTFFSAEPWTEDHEARLGKLLPDVDATWEHRLSNDATLIHGNVNGQYRIRVTGGGLESPEAHLFDRLFSGPIVPEATPNPRHIRFPLGGKPGDSVFYERDGAVDDARVAALFEHPDVADVLVAPDFVAVGLDRADKWESRIDQILELVTSEFKSRGATLAMETPTRDELVSTPSSHQALHLLNPDAPDDRAALVAELGSADARIRRLALATAGNSADAAFVQSVLVDHSQDPSRIVRRTAGDGAVDQEDAGLRSLLEGWLTDDDAWIRWKALRGLNDLGIEPSVVAELADDPDFRVRLEAARSTHDRNLNHVRIEVFPTKEDAAHQAALAIADSLIGAARDPLFGLAGGSTPRLTYDKLAELDVDWNRVTAFLGDERWVPLDDPESNYRMVSETALGSAGLTVLPVEYGADPNAAAASYAARLAAQPDPSVLLLGMGDDGHTASLFPGTDALTGDGTYVANWVPEKDSWRLTITFDYLARAEQVIFLVTGENKAARLAEVMSGGSDLPAAEAVRRARQVTWFLDEAAAAQL